MQIGGWSRSLLVRTPPDSLSQKIERSPSTMMSRPCGRDAGVCLPHVMALALSPRLTDLQVAIRALIAP
jgi:hypothetical protein